jgi:hypothetical protein
LCCSGRQVKTKLKNSRKMAEKATYIIDQRKVTTRMVGW